MKLERSKPEDMNECVAWMAENLERNDCSARTLKGCTFYKIQSILYLPIKPVLLLESLAPNPLVTGKKRLLALRRAVEDLQKLYPGVELVFLTRSDLKLTEAAKSYGFEEAKGYVLCRLLDAPLRRKEAQTTKKELAQIRLQRHPGVCRTDETPAAGVMPGLREGARRESARA